MRARPLLAALALALAACSAGGSKRAEGPSSTSNPPASTTLVPSSPSSTAPGRPCLPADGPASSRTNTSVPALAAVQVVGPDQAWAVGSSLIIHTADGGRTWTKQYGGPDEVVSVDFVDATHGWAPSPSGLLATDDGGQCWTERSVPSPPVHAVHFVDPSLGWGVAGGDRGFLSVPDQGGVLVRTADGGRTWAAQPSPADVQRVCFTDDRHGWLVAGGGLLGTDDAGGHWNPVVLATTAQPWRGAEVQCTPGVAWVVATDGAATGHQAYALYRVPAGGPATPILAESFTQPVDAAPSQTSYPGPLSAISPSAVVMAGFTPGYDPGRAALLTVVVDDGHTIRPPGTPVPDIEEANGASFSSPDAGWVVGDVPGPANAARQRSGRVIRTTDGGKTWAIQYRTD